MGTGHTLVIEDVRQPFAVMTVRMVKGNPQAVPLVEGYLDLARSSVVLKLSSVGAIYYSGIIRSGRAGRINLEKLGASRFETLLGLPHNTTLRIAEEQGVDPSAVSPLELIRAAQKGESRFIVGRSTKSVNLKLEKTVRVSLNDLLELNSESKESDSQTLQRLISGLHQSQALRREGSLLQPVKLIRARSVDEGDQLVVRHAMQEALRENGLPVSRSWLLRDPVTDSVVLVHDRSDRQAFKAELDAQGARFPRGAYYAGKPVLSLLEVIHLLGGKAHSLDPVSAANAAALISSQIGSDLSFPMTMAAVSVAIGEAGLNGNHLQYRLSRGIDGNLRLEPWVSEEMSPSLNTNQRRVELERAGLAGAVLDHLDANRIRTTNLALEALYNRDPSAFTIVSESALKVKDTFVAKAKNLSQEGWLRGSAREALETFFRRPLGITGIRSLASRVEGKGGLTIIGGEDAINKVREALEDGTVPTLG